MAKVLLVDAVSPAKELGVTRRCKGSVHRWGAQIDQRRVPRCSPLPKAGMAYSLRRCFWAFATLRLTELCANSTILWCRWRRSGLFRTRGLQPEHEICDPYLTRTNLGQIRVTITRDFDLSILAGAHLPVQQVRWLSGSWMGLDVGACVPDNLGPDPKKTGAEGGAWTRDLPIAFRHAKYIGFQAVSLCRREQKWTHLGAVVITNVSKLLDCWRSWPPGNPSSEKLRIPMKVARPGPRRMNKGAYKRREPPLQISLNRPHRTA